MAIYRPRRPRWHVLLGVAIVALATGMLLGWLIGSRAADPVDAAKEIRGVMTSAATILGVVEVEYAESVRDGRVVNEAEYAGARDALDRSRTQYEEIEPALAVIAPAAAAEIGRSYEHLAQMIASRADANSVKSASATLINLLAGPRGPVSD